MSEIFECECCGLRFDDEHWHGGAIDHENTRSNLDVFEYRWDSNQFDNHNLFLDILGLDSSLNDMDDETQEVGEQKLNCVIAHFDKINRLDICCALEVMKGDVTRQFNLVRLRIIKRLEDQIAKEKLKLRAE